MWVQEEEKSKIFANIQIFIFNFFGDVFPYLVGERMCLSLHSIQLLWIKAN